MSLAIVAGRGDLPKIIIKKCQQDNRKFIILLIEGQVSNEDYLQYQHYTLPIGQIGKALRIFRENQVKDIVFAGGIDKPSMTNIKVDGKGAMLLAKITGVKLFGDDNVLTAVTNFFKKEGFNILGAHQIVDDLVIDKGVLGKVKADKKFLTDIELGKKIIHTISEFDVGQSVVVQQNTIIGIEAKEGTDNLISRSGKVQFPKGRKPILIKMKKLGQNTAVDLPSIGIKTIENLHQNNFAGLAIEAGASLILDKQQVIKLADQYKLFIIGL